MQLQRLDGFNISDIEARFIILLIICVLITPVPGHCLLVTFCNFVSIV